MKEIELNENLIAACGLYCGGCGAYRKGRCPGCKDNSKASWCKVRSCCQENKITSCAECHTIADFKNCKKLNNPIAKIFSFVFRSNRMKSLQYIREHSRTNYAQEMVKQKRHAFKRD